MMIKSGRQSWFVASLAAGLLWAVTIGVSSVDAAQHAAGDTAAHTEEGASSAGGPNPLSTDPDLAIWTAVVFALLLLVLGKFAWRPIMEALERREQSVADHISSAEQKHEEAKQQLVAYEQKLASASDEVREMLEEARRDAEHTKQEIISEAKAAAQAEHERALRDVRTAKEAALKEIGESGAAFAVELAGKIVRKELSEKDHASMIRDAVSQFPNPN